MESRMSDLNRLFEPVLGQQIALAEGPEYEALLTCIRCARCLPVCPTYQETLHGRNPPGGAWPCFGRWRRAGCPSMSPWRLISIIAWIAGRATRSARRGSPSES